MLLLITKNHQMKMKEVLQSVNPDYSILNEQSTPSSGREIYNRAPVVKIETQRLKWLINYVKSLHFQYYSQRADWLYTTAE